MKSYLCKCNNCGSIFYDENPKSENLLINTEKINLSILPMELLNEEGDSFYGCGNCKTDGYLTDIDDLFNFHELLPAEIKAILDTFDCETLSYQDCQSMLAQMEENGYTFDYDLGAAPYNLRILENTVTYCRKPTAAEIKFGHGATHYKDFPLSQCTKKDGNYKKWLVCPVDGLRYYY